jgi:hypothetical protein
MGCGALAYLYLPMTLAFTPAWIAYAVVAGTCSTGCWVVGPPSLFPFSRLTVCTHCTSALVRRGGGHLLHGVLGGGAAPCPPFYVFIST